MKPQRSQSLAETGMSLIEMMIGLALLSLVGYFAATFFKRVGDSDAELSAKQKAVGELERFVGTVERDLKYRDMNNLTDVCAGTCQNFELTRLAPLSGGGEGTYTVRFTSRCQNIPANAAGKLQSINFADPSGIIYTNNRGTCMRAVACGPGTYPVIAIQTLNVTTGVSVPQYPAFFPDLNDQAIASNIIGASLCVQSTAGSNSNRIIVDAATLGSGSAVRIESRQTIFSNRNVANIQMLPN